MPINRNFFPRICPSFIFSHSRIIRKNYRKSFDILITHLTKAGRPKTLEHERIFGGGESSLMITFLKREAKRALLESTGIHSSITLISSIRCRGPATRNRRKQKEGKIEREREGRPVYILVDGGVFASGLGSRASFQKFLIPERAAYRSLWRGRYATLLTAPDV